MCLRVTVDTCLVKLPEPFMYLTDPITIPPLPPLQVEVILLVYLTSLAATSFVQPPIGGLNYNMKTSENI